MSLKFTITKTKKISHFKEILNTWQTIEHRGKLTILEYHIFRLFYIIKKKNEL